MFQALAFRLSELSNCLETRNLVICIEFKSNEDMILALAGQFKQLSDEPEKFR